MLLSRPAGYAIDAVVQLAKSPGDVPVSSSQLAAAGNLPSRYLLAILRRLVKRGILRSRRGADGGYLLAREPGEISLLSLIEAVDGPLNEIWVCPETRSGRIESAPRATPHLDWRFGARSEPFSANAVDDQWSGGGTATLLAVDEATGGHTASKCKSSPSVGRRRASDMAFIKLTRAARGFLDAITLADLLDASPHSPTPLALRTLHVGMAASDPAVREWVI